MGRQAAQVDRHITTHVTPHTFFLTAIPFARILGMPQFVMGGYEERPCSTPTP